MNVGLGGKLLVEVDHYEYLGSYIAGNIGFDRDLMQRISKEHNV